MYWLQAFYMLYHGPEGLTRIADRTHAMAALTASHVRHVPGVTVGSGAFFDTVHVTVAAPLTADKVNTHTTLAINTANNPYPSRDYLSRHLP